MARAWQPYLDEPVENSKRDSRDQEDGSDDSNDDEYVQHVEEAVDETVDSLGQQLINGVHIQREAVQDPSQGGGVEEGHW